jgi:antitoxin ParD1/3/4
MTTLNISLPDQMKDFVDEQVGERGYQSPSDYFQDLLRKEQKRKAEEELEQLLEKGLSSGTAKMDEKDWADIRSELDSRIAETKETTS